MQKGLKSNKWGNFAFFRYLCSGYTYTQILFEDILTLSPINLNPNNFNNLHFRPSNQIPRPPHNALSLHSLNGG